MDIIDAHVHLPTRETCSDLRSKKERLLQELDENNVSACIAIADSWHESAIGSTDELVKLFPETNDPRVYVVGGISPFVSYREDLAKFREHLDNGRIVGIKLYTGHEHFYLDDERLTEVYEMAQEYDVPVLFHSGWDDPQYGDVDRAAEIVGKYPALKLICCHCWYPDINKCMQLTHSPNMFFDLSSVADDAAVFNRISDDVKKLIETIPDRVIFGSDSFGCSMAEHIRSVNELGLAPDTLQKVMAGNAKRVYRLKG